jgi:hypothetical protein
MAVPALVNVAGWRLLRREPDGSLIQHADLSGISDKPWSDVVVDDRGVFSLHGHWVLACPVASPLPGKKFAL